MKYWQIAFFICFSLLLACVKGSREATEKTQTTAGTNSTGSSNESDLIFNLEPSFSNYSFDVEFSKQQDCAYAIESETEIDSDFYRPSTQVESGTYYLCGVEHNLDDSNSQREFSLSTTYVQTDTFLPEVTFVSDLNVPAVSLAGVNQEASLNVVCNRSGSVRIQDAADDDVISVWSTIESFLPTPISVSANIINTVGVEGDNVLKITCKDSLEVESAADESKTIVFDNSPPPNLDGFSGVTGPTTGGITLTVTYPASVDDYYQLTVRRVLGGSAPMDCSDGDVAFTESSSFSSGIVNDDTGSTSGESFSYRACVFDAAGNVNSASTVLNIQALDNAVLPASIDEFSGATGSGHGDIDLTLDFGVTSDYDTVEVRRLAGSTAPDADCTSDGVVIKTYLTPTFPDEVLTDTVTAGSFYSYRLCISDGSGNLASSQTVTNVQAEQLCSGDLYGGYCWYLGAVNQSCTSVCSTHGGYDSATASYAGSGGSQANCDNVLDALSAPAGSITTTSGIALGCAKTDGSSDRWWWSGPATTAGSANVSMQRACACQQ